MSHSYDYDYINVALTIMEKSDQPRWENRIWTNKCDLDTFCRKNMMIDH